MRRSISVRMPNLLVCLVALGLVLTWCVPHSALRASAQESLLGTPITPEPSECVVAPRPTESLLRIGSLATSEAPATEANSEMDPAIIPPSSPADQATVHVAVGLVRQYIACLNAFDWVRSFGLLTDDYLAKVLFDYGPLPGLVLSAGQVPPGVTADVWRSFAVSSVGVLPDGRIAAVVNVLNPSSDSGFTPGHLTQVTYLLAPGEQGLLIDMLAIDPANRPNEVISGNGFVGVTFQAERASQLAEFFGDADRYDRFWQPTRRQIVALEQALMPYLESQSVALAARVEYEEYGRQYAGAIQDGIPIIIVNAFCDPDDLTWLQTPFTVDDGGNCYFSVRWDVATGTFFELRINGDA